MAQVALLAEMARERRVSKQRKCLNCRKYLMLAWSEGIGITVTKT